MDTQPDQSDIGALASRTEELRAWLTEARSQISGIDWYLYDILGNLGALGALLGPGRDLASLTGGQPVADIGAADGDLSFVLERELGWQLDIVDNAPTNMNGLRGARALAEHLGSRVEIHDLDLDTQFSLPRERYGLVLLLGILYHLQNPFYVLRELAQHADYLAISTRVARVAGPADIPIADLPVAYLVGPDETNHDATNYWMFSPAGLERIVTRAGWSVVSSFSGGDTVTSNPSAMDRDERQFMLLRSALPHSGSSQA
jgi:tRNA (mo5U34)-methyltransferase